MKKLLVALAFLATACTAKTAADVISVLNAIQTACIDAELALSIVTGDQAPEVAELKLACNLDGYADQLVQQAVQNWEAQPAVSQMKMVKRGAP